MRNLFGTKVIIVAIELALIFLGVLASQNVSAKWDEERDMTTNGKEELIYYYKTNEQGQKLVLDKYVKRLIFIRPDKLYKRSIKQIKIDGMVVEVTSDPFSRYPEQTAIIFDNKDEVLKKLFLAKKIEFNVFYGREESVSTFLIK
ncbi:hypothetical protein [Polynucleobacter sp. MWH-Braz-FAM2G]|uniref:hypothetical protein n=1 Tax=Polynucleobacter sp. MWH-Braz-FAM2G TaxID=1855883 RepID=UPI001BFDA972|nr:hypothetical protein [Polynucleobacter sp. MWH-Braz-FAM2G]QWD90558.1 hypothetical protein FD973_09810 [Polynucleobacter sp. MWH-Braz-FAM2G]